MFLVWNLGCHILWIVQESQVASCHTRTPADLTWSSLSFAGLNCPSSTKPQNLEFLVFSRHQQGSIVLREINLIILPPTFEFTSYLPPQRLLRFPPVTSQ
ncbi:hypothetical protein AMECASPLE_030992 [Ameca splendens]|uniref:Secreted protein n=2 Tax=Goodeidae TaxID=28758 RepID=A0ABV0PT04_9TELE